MKVLPWILLIVGAIVVSCGPAAKLRRAEKLIKKAEEQGAVWKVDTVFQKIPVPVPQIEVRAVHHALPGDTVVIEKERLKIKVVKIPGDSIFVEGKCEADTITLTVTKTINKTIEAKSGWPWWWLLVAAAGGMILGAIIRLIK